MANIKRTREDSVSDHDTDLPEKASRSRSQSTEPEVHRSKYASLEPTIQESPAMRCLLPPHKPLSFETYDEYEAHCQKDHTNRCTECKKNLPSSHFLELHIAENHDPIAASKRDAGEKIFACFVEGCDKVCGEWQKRRMHLVDKHGYPKNYDFFLVNTGIDGRRSMLRTGIDAQGHRKSSRERERSNSSATQSTQSTGATSVAEHDGSTAAVASPKSASGARKDGVHEKQPKSNSTVDDLAHSMSSLNMIPRSITFGRRKGHSGFAKQ